jgi:hypothetical protein
MLSAHGHHGAGALSGQILLPAAIVEKAEKALSQDCAQRVRQALGKIHSLDGPFDRLIGIAKQPRSPYPNVSTTDPRVVATVNKFVRAVLLTIVESEALLGVVTTGVEHIRHRHVVPAAW